jgi:hypothetical protein
MTERRPQTLRVVSRPQDMTRQDAVNFIVHGIAKEGERNWGAYW